MFGDHFNTSLLTEKPYPAWAATTDLALAIYPIFMLWNVQIATRLKAGLCILMGLGVVSLYIQFTCSLMKSSGTLAIGSVRS